eukprot:359066-Chlamydomonas_euryale.AAC.1
MHVGRQHGAPPAEDRLKHAHMCERSPMHTCMKAALCGCMQPPAPPCRFLNLHAAPRASVELCTPPCSLHAVTSVKPYARPPHAASRPPPMHLAMRARQPHAASRPPPQCNWLC